jgi:hypothetical protein
VDPDEDLALQWDGPLGVFESQDVGGAVPVVDNGPQSAEPEMWVLIGHQRESIGVYSVAASNDSNDKVELDSVDTYR